MKKFRHDYNKILSRLTTILTRLYNGERLSQSELAKEFGVSERTIERDLYERLKGFPIKKIKKMWQLLDGANIGKDFQDRIVVEILDKIAQDIGGEFYQKSHHLLQRLKVSSNPFFAKLDIENIDDKLHEIAQLEKAIKEKRKIVCQYKGAQGSFQAELKPLKIVNFEGFWYLIALDKESIKKYYLKNISSITITDEHFDITPHIDKLLQNSISIWFADKKPFEVRLFIEAPVAKYFKRKPLPTQTILGEDSDGSIEVSLKITHEMEIIPIIKHWIPHIVPLEPKWLREEIEKEVKIFLQKLTQIQGCS